MRPTIEPRRRHLSVIAAVALALAALVVAPGTAVAGAATPSGTTACSTWQYRIKTIALIHNSAAGSWSGGINDTAVTDDIVNVNLNSGEWSRGNFYPPDKSFIYHPNGWIAHGYLDYIQCW